MNKTMGWMLVASLLVPVPADPDVPDFPDVPEQVPCQEQLEEIVEPEEELPLDPQVEEVNMDCQEEGETEEEEKQDKAQNGEQKEGDSTEDPQKPRIVAGKKVPEPKPIPQRRQEEEEEPVSLVEAEAEPEGEEMVHLSSAPEGGPLPQTATPHPSMAMIGGALTLAGAAFLWIQKTKS